MKSLYELTGDATALQHLAMSLVDEEGNDRAPTDEEREAFLAWINESETNIHAKVDNIGRFIRNTESEIDLIGGELKPFADEVKRLSARIKQRENLVKRLKFLVLESLMRLQQKEYKTALFTFSRCATPKAVIINEDMLNIEDLPNEWVKKEVSKSAIKESISSGDALIVDLHIKYHGKDINGIKYVGGETCRLK
jgi:hypothetical protein